MSKEIIKLLNYLNDFCKDPFAYNNDGVALLKDNQPMQILVCIKDLQQKVEQLENIRKEAIKYVKEHARIDDEYPAYIEMLLEEKQDLLNILNRCNK